jgi:hypothetical protein
LHKVDYKKSDALRFHRRGQLVEDSALPARQVLGVSPADKL